jgi:lipopolysaccharide assembly outer membrane protein LptD (OstA)
VYRENSFETLDLQGKLKVFKPLSIFFDARYDLRENDDLDTLFGIDLELGCWGTRVWIENSSGSSGRKSETSVRFSIYLIGLNVNTQQANQY